MSKIASKLRDVERFVVERDRIREELKRLEGLDGPHAQSTRDYLRQSVYGMVLRYVDNERVFAAAMALDDFDPGIRGMPKDHPMLWGLAAVLGRRMKTFFKLNYMRRLANEMADAAKKCIDARDIPKHLASPKKSESRMPRSESLHKRHPKGSTRGALKPKVQERGNRKK